MEFVVPRDIQGMHDMFNNVPIFILKNVSLIDQSMDKLLFWCFAGGLGDCWLMSALSCLGQYPQKLILGDNIRHEDPQKGLLHKDILGKDPKYCTNENHHVIMYIFSNLRQWNMCYWGIAIGRLGSKHPTSASSTEFHVCWIIVYPVHHGNPKRYLLKQWFSFAVSEMQVYIVYICILQVDILYVFMSVISDLLRKSLFSANQLAEDGKYEVYLYNMEKLSFWREQVSQLSQLCTLLFGNCWFDRSCTRLDDHWFVDPIVWLENNELVQVMGLFYPFLGSWFKDEGDFGTPPTSKSKIDMDSLVWAGYRIREIWKDCVIFWTCACL